MKKKSIILATLSALCTMLFVTSCGNSNQSLKIYSEETFQYDIVCSTQLTSEDARAITTLTDLLEERCGKSPTLVYDSGTEDQDKKPEILIGRLERSESKLPELKDKETYWCVKKSGEDIVINGSTSTALQMAMDYFVSLCSYDRDTATFQVSGDLSKEEQKKGYYRDCWMLTDIPSYWGDNELNSFVYDCGTVVTSKNPKEGSCLMQTITSTNAEEAADYAKLLEENGFKQTSYNAMENNEFYRFTKDNYKLSLNYFGDDEAADVIWDKTSVATTDLSYTYEPKRGERAEFYSYGLKHANYDDPSKNTTSIEGGLSMVIKCADNSVIVIDGGGSTGQLDYAAQSKFMDFLYQITDTPKGQKVRISAWYVTHAHGDHVNGVSEFLSNYAASVNLERIITNLPSAEFVDSSDSNIANMKKGLQMHNCQEMKVHTGDIIQIADITMEILYTHEDLATINGAWGSYESNDASVVAKLTSSEGMSLLMTGDMDVSSCVVLEEHFSTETLKSTFGLIPHHLYNAIPQSWYEAVSPQYFVAGQSPYNNKGNDNASSQAARGEKFSEALYYGHNTYGFVYENGRAVQIYEELMY